MEPREVWAVFGAVFGAAQGEGVQVPAWLLHVAFPISSQVQPTVCDRQRQEEPVQVLQAEEVLQSWHEERRWVQGDISNLPAAVLGPVPLQSRVGSSSTGWRDDAAQIFFIAAESPICHFISISMRAW